MRNGLVNRWLMPRRPICSSIKTLPSRTKSTSIIAEVASADARERGEEAEASGLTGEVKAILSKKQKDTTA